VVEFVSYFYQDFEKGGMDSAHLCVDRNGWYRKGGHRKKHAGKLIREPSYFGLLNVSDSSPP